MKRSNLLLALVAASLLLPATLGADDKWDLSSFYNDDGPDTGWNQLLPGTRQTHDLQGSGVPPDVDFSIVAVKNRHSYEARLDSGSVAFGTPTVCPDCVRFARTDIANVLQQDATDPDGALSGAAGTGDTSLVIRWIAPATEYEFLRVTGYNGFPMTDQDQYDITFRDTTAYAPRWNQSGTQITVFLIQNNTDAPVSGSVFFSNAAGALLHTAALSIPVGGLQNISTAAIPALSGLSGSAMIAHDGGYGALSGKAVALEPGTGFTFDTLIVPFPY